MPEILRHPRFPSILCAVGPEFVSSSVMDPRPPLDTAAVAGVSPLLRRGGYDWWVVYRVPGLPIVPWQPNYVRGYQAARRGAMHMNTISTTDVGTLDGHIAILLHELGHEWLVPGDLAFDVGGRRIEMLSNADHLRRVNEGVDWGAPALLGRDQLHWSVYVRSESMMDSPNWNDVGVRNGLRRWDQMTAPRSQVSDGGSVRVPIWRFSDLDLILMGALSADAAYPQESNEVRLMQPDFVTSPVVGYLGGVIVYDNAGEEWLFGFLSDPRRLGVMRKSQATPTSAGTVATFDLGDDWPLQQDVLFRVRARSDRLQFEAALAGGAATISSPPGNPAASGSPLSSSAFTVIHDSPASSVVAIGSIARTWTGVLFEFEAGSYSVLSNARVTTFDSSTLPPEARPGPYFQGSCPAPSERSHLQCGHPAKPPLTCGPRRVRESGIRFCGAS
jgi:hypothetical protein